MTKREFAELMKEKVEERFGEGHKVEIMEVSKNNGVVLTGLTVKNENLNIAPTVYLDGLYEDCQDGKDPELAAKVLIGSLEHGFPKSRVDMSYFSDFEQVKDKVCFRVVNAERNAAALEGQPHVPFMDEAVTFFVPFYNDEIGSGSITVKNEHAEKWGVTTDDLMEAARVNTPRLFPPRCIRMDNVLLELTGHGPKDYDEVPVRPFKDEAFPMHVLTNQDRNYGAGVMKYDGYLQRVADAAECDLYVIGSSVHELIILPKEEGMTADFLRGLVQEVNSTTVEKQDFLSDNVYQYDRQTQTLSICEEQSQTLDEGMEGASEAAEFMGPVMGM